jgi:DNA invertase Pin-like site-specific DNA recombinase
LSVTRAIAEGTRFGRRPKLTKHRAREALKRVAAGESLREIALSYAIDHSTINRLKAPPRSRDLTATGSSKS